MSKGNLLHTALAWVCAASGLFASLAGAADGAMTTLPTISTDGKTYAAVFAAGLSSDNGLSFRSTASVSDSVLIRGTINPDPAHIGMTGDLFVVERFGSQWTMKTPGGAFIPWNTTIATLVPFREDVTLAASNTVDVYAGRISNAGDHRIFLGYMPASGAGLIYTSTALRLPITDVVGTNGRALPFEAGYFPGLDSPKVVATVSGIEVIADDRTLVTSYPLDRLIVRTLLLRNTNAQRVRIMHSAAMSFTGYDAAQFTRHPQDAYVYLEPGETQPYRLTYEIPGQGSSWKLGDAIPVTMSLSMRVQLNPLSGFTPEVAVTLPARIDVVRSPADTGNTAVPAANATITGTARDGTTGLPLANTELEMIYGLSDTGIYRATTNALGEYTFNVFAYLRTGGAPSWKEYSIRRFASRNSYYPQPIVIPRAGETLSADVSLHSAGTEVTYEMTGYLDLDLNAYASDASLSGNTVATVPFHAETLPLATQQARSKLSVFSVAGTVLFQLPINGLTPAVDVADDGSLVATTTQNIISGSPFQTGGKAIVLTRTGQQVLEVPLLATNDSGWNDALDVPFMEVRLSRDKRFLAVGDNIGRAMLVEVATGAQLWRKFLNGPVRRIDFDLNDERVFVSGGDGWLRAYTLSGGILWKAWVDSWVTSMDVSARYILAIGKSHRSGLHLIDKVTGATLWVYQTDYAANQVRIAADESYVYATSAGPPIHSVFSIDGLPLTRVAGNVNAVATSADGNVIAYSDGCNFSVFDRLWRPVFRSEALADAANCINGRNHLVAMSRDGAFITAAAGEMPNMTGRAYFFRRSGASIPAGF